MRERGGVRERESTRECGGEGGSAGEGESEKTGDREMTRAKRKREILESIYKPLRATYRSCCGGDIVVGMPVIDVRKTSNHSCGVYTFLTSQRYTPK